MFAWVHRWPRNAAMTAGVALLMLGWSVSGMWGLLNASPAPTGDYLRMLNEITQEGQPEGENAWPMYRAILADDFGIRTQSDRGNATWLMLHGFLNESMLLRGDWEALNRDADIAVIEYIKPILKKLDRAAERPRSVRPINADGALTDEFVPGGDIVTTLNLGNMNVLGPLSRLSGLNTRAMRISAEQADWGDAAQRFRTGLAMGLHLSRQPTIVEQAITVWQTLWPLKELATLLNEKEIPAGMCAAMIDAIDTHDWSAAASMRRAVHGERVLLLGRIESSSTASGMMLPSVWMSRGSTTTLKSRLFNLAAPWLSRRREAIAIAEEWTRRSFEMISMKSEDRIDTEKRIYEDLIEPRASLSIIFWGSLRHGFDALEWTETLRAGVRIMLRLEIFFEQTGAWPTSLTQAMSEEEASDPISGEPFEFDLTPNDPDARPYELRAPWSIPRAPALDSVINTPRILAAP